MSNLFDRLPLRRYVPTWALRKGLGLSVGGRLLYLGLWLTADHWGRGWWSPLVLRQRCGWVSLEDDIVAAMRELEASGLIELFDVAESLNEGVPVFQIVDHDKDAEPAILKRRPASRWKREGDR